MPFNDLSGVVEAKASGSFGRGQVGLKVGPFDIGETCRVCCSHAR